MSKMSQDEQDRIWDILSMFHEHGAGWCRDSDAFPERKGKLAPECKLLRDTYEVIVSGKTADEWWEKKFKGDYPKWNRWRIARGIIKGETK